MSRSPARAPVLPVSFLFFSAGALALAVQVLLLRELLVSLQGDETAVGLGLASWLGGIAAGAAAGRRLARERPARAAAAGLGLLAVAGVAELLAARVARLALPAAPGEVLALGASLLLAIAVMAIPGALVGLTFTALAAAAARAGFADGAAISRLYVLEAAGSLASGLAVTFVLIPIASPLHAAAIAGALALAAALPASRLGLIPGRVALPAVALGLVLLALPPVSSGLEEATERARFRAIVPGIPLVEWLDTPYQHVSIAGDSVRHLYAGGQYVGSFPDTEEQEIETHAAACLAPRPARVLAVGGLALGGLRFLLLHPVERVDLVEMDERAFDLVRRLLPREDAEALRDRRVRIVFDDPRAYLARGGEPYELILVRQPDPVTLLLARLSTAEFFRLAASRLAPDGVLATSLGTPPNVLTGEAASLGGSVYRALRSAFPVVLATPGPEGLLVAGFRADAATLDPAILASRFRERKIASRAVVPETFALLFPKERVEAQESALRRAAAEVPASLDERPVSFLHALALRQTIAGSALARRLSGSRFPGTWGPVLLALLPSLALVATCAVRRARGRPARALAALHAVTVTGACGMAWSLVLLFAFQTRVGALYGQLGWLTAAFMCGLAVGGWGARAAAEASDEASDRWLLAAGGLALAFAILLPAVLASIGGAASHSRWSAALPLGALLVLSGVATGTMFPAAAGVLLSHGAGARDAAARVEAADHAGAALAALSVAVLFVPTLGLRATCLVLALLEGLSAVAILLAVTPSKRTA
jgi:spermidine synthase